MRITIRGDELLKAELRKWHRWFAWYPVRTGDDELRWLETVERRYVVFGGFFTDPVVQFRVVEA